MWDLYGMINLRELDRAAERRWPRVFAGENSPLEWQVNFAIFMLGAGLLVSLALAADGQMVAAWATSNGTAAGVFGVLIALRSRLGR